MPSLPDLRIAIQWSNAIHLEHALRSVRVAPKPAREVAVAEYGMHTVPTLVVCLHGVIRTEFPRSRIDLAVNEGLLIPLGTPHKHADLKHGCTLFGMGFKFGFSDIVLKVGGGENWTMTIPEQPARSLIDAALKADAVERLRLIRSALSQLHPDMAQPLAPMPDPTYRMWMYLYRNRLSPISTRDVLRASGLGLSQAYVLFRAYFRTTPLEMLRRNRLEYALHLIAQGSSIAEAATQSGFHNRRHLTSACRKVHGAPPTRAGGR